MTGILAILAETTAFSGAQAGAGAGAGVRDDWNAVRRSAEIQFAPLPPPKPVTTPAWLDWLDGLLRAVFGPLAKALVQAWPVIQYLLAGLGIALLAWLLWTLIAPALGWRPRRGAEEPWTPTREEALALLEDADRLAAQGRFGEAAHLLLQRSVGQIRAARPAALVPASTAREIANLPQLPERARAAFALIAARVERCLFALRDLDAGDWAAARAAYADFALTDLRA